MGSDAQKVFPFEVFLDQLRKFAKYAIFLAPLIMLLLYADIDSMPDMDDVAKKVNAGESYDEIELISDAEKRKLFNQRVVDLFDDMIRFGYI